MIGWWQKYSPHQPSRPDLFDQPAGVEPFCATIDLSALIDLLIAHWEESRYRGYLKTYQYSFLQEQPDRFVPGQFRCTVHLID